MIATCQYSNNSQEGCSAPTSGAFCDKCGLLCRSCTNKPCPLTGTFHVLVSVAPQEPDYGEPVVTLISSDGQLYPVRKSVAQFARLMNQKLDERTEKRGGGRPKWIGRRFQELLCDLEQEMTELENALAGQEWIEAGREAADVANFAMIIADVVGALGDTA